MIASRVTLTLAAGALVLILACDVTSPSSTDCSEEPEPACYDCAASPPGVPVCEQGEWVCPPSTGPCPGEPDDASTPADASPDTGRAPEGGSPCTDDADCKMLDGATE
ncbi:MAG: hypothetical protein ACLQVI_14470 [Polyangiaceae bacterium]|jgi:hypothetical protein